MDRISLSGWGARLSDTVFDVAFSRGGVLWVHGGENVRYYAAMKDLKA